MSNLAVTGKAAAKNECGPMVYEKVKAMSIDELAQYICDQRSQPVSSSIVADWFIDDQTELKFPSEFERITIGDLHFNFSTYHYGFKQTFNLHCNGTIIFHEKLANGITKAVMKKALKEMQKKIARIRQHQDKSPLALQH